MLESDVHRVYGADRRNKANSLIGMFVARRMLWWVGVPAGLLTAVGALFGPLAVGLGVAQALTAIFILEDVNYIEHYGLQRSLTRSGRCAGPFSWHKPPLSPAIKGTYNLV